MTTESATELAAKRAARDSYGRLLSLLAMRGPGLADAEDALADAFAAALLQWPRDGVPTNPDGWLHAVARRRLVDAARRRTTMSTNVADLKIVIEELAEAAEANALPDRRLALMLACASEAVPQPMRTALMLNVILGLTAEEIAPLYLVAPKTMGQRLSRGKARLRQAGIGFEEPDEQALAERLPAILDAVYAAFTKSFADGETHRALGEEAIYLARLSARLAPEPEALGLLALVLHSAARAPARRDADGAYVALDDQDATRWDRDLIVEAESALAQASRNGGETGRFQIEAAIQSAKAAAALTGADTRVDVLRLYDLLLALFPTPVVALNRAVARWRVPGETSCFAEIVALEDEEGMKTYQPYWAARLAVADAEGRTQEAREARDITLGLTADPHVRRWIMTRYG